MIQVHSYMRSGTNLLLTSLALNFIELKGSLFMEITREDFNHLKLHSQFGEIEYDNVRGGFDHPYKHLFGSHSPCTRYTPESLFIIRNPLDTLFSLYNFLGAGLSWNKKPTGTFSAFALKHSYRWIDHVNSFITRGVPYIFYEDLVSDYEGTLRRIEYSFPVTLNEEIVKVNSLVGWSPLEGNVQRDYPKELTEKIEARIRKSTRLGAPLIYTKYWGCK